MARSKPGSSVTESISKVFRIVGGRVSTGPRKPDGGEPPPAVDTAAVVPQLPTDEQLRELAYRKWEEAGHPPGDGTEFWLAAERELSGK
jgi:hypothetical protein